LGSVRTEQIKRISRELLRRFPDKFSDNFEHNKRIVSMLAQGATIKVRNQIAGYITHALAGMKIASSSQEEEAESDE
jgi:small subunit ribosomal protein S17e